MMSDAFQTFYASYASSHSVSSEQSKAAMCISECKTGTLGYNISYCRSCGHIEIHACSCNNRNCPCCQSPQEQKWIRTRNSELCCYQMFRRSRLILKVSERLTIL